MTEQKAASFIAACVQMNSGRDVAPNIAAAGDLIRAAHAKGAQLVVTPENTTLIEPDKKASLAKTPYEAEHPGLAAFGDLARDLGIWLVIGSMPVRAEETRIANRQFVFDPAGRIAARYDKIHMFDVDLATGESHRESAQVRPGHEAVIAATPWGGLGLTICYDVRFAYLHRALAQAGAIMLTGPAAFTVPTGEAHWHVLLRARAIETGCFMFAAAQVGTHAEGRATYGHSLIIDPWGKVLADAGTGIGVVTAEIDTSLVKKARHAVPALTHDRSFTRPAAPLSAAGE
ncbi:putative amidohydrolase [Dongia mobilis]|uniref:Putative amidohydrolase n=1 Tax=Dongia mobilis TaxID=578943 RepID=A0A4R6X153_9PROT|nr:carbon-nitrogen hydrolase family protein [Dongia mobilis]TDQ84188.1 putative amidohydrolase [Dongia mobilis]